MPQRSRGGLGMVLAGVGLIAILGCILSCIMMNMWVQIAGGGAGTTGNADQTAGITYTRPAGGVGGTPTNRATPTRTTPASGQVGIVALDASTDPGAADVAAMFNTYFSGINQRDWDSVLALYDPAGVVDPSDPAQRDSFIASMSTTTDSEIRILQVQTVGGAASARLTFRSKQTAGYGPKARPSETCTRWDITYALTFDGSGYRILRPQGNTNRSC